MEAVDSLEEMASKITSEFEIDEETAKQDAAESIRIGNERVELMRKYGIIK